MAPACAAEVVPVTTRHYDAPMKAESAALTAETLIDFLDGQLGIDIGGVQAGTPLFTSGLIDSFGLVSLITFVEQGSGVVVQPADVTLDNIDSIQRILAFVERARGSP